MAERKLRQLEALNRLSTPEAASPRRFRNAVDKFPEARLGRKRARTPTTGHALLHGQIQHQLYRAGQIALLRRGLGRPVPS